MGVFHKIGFLTYKIMSKTLEMAFERLWIQTFLSERSAEPRTERCIPGTRVAFNHPNACHSFRRPCLKMYINYNFQLTCMQNN